MNEIDTIKHQRLLASLVPLMEEWLGRNAESDLAIGYYGKGTDWLMAVAAITVLEAVDDVYKTLVANGEIKNE